MGGRSGLFLYLRRLSFLLDSNLAAIVTACRAYCVINVELAAVRAYCQCRSYSLIMSSSLEGSSLGLSSFRMCHFVLIFNCYFINFFNSAHLGSTGASSATSSPSSQSSSLLRVARCSFRASIIALLHFPGACTCLMGIARAINS